ncbi:MAG: TRAM domain-containing protein [Actinomycetota bacterium]|nr:TRAM domain-containing protein [Actinomycetota bacterium]
MRPDVPEAGAPRALPRYHGGSTLVELVRLAVVVLSTATAAQAWVAPPLLEAVFGAESGRLLLTVLGAAVGYVIGGVLGRLAVGRIDAAERNLQRVSSAELLAGSFGGFVGLGVAGALTWPLLLLEARALGLPLAMLIVVLLAGTGVRVGMARGGDLLRYQGVSGRPAVASPSHGPCAKIVDTSALVDGRLVDVCQAGFVEGALVVPRFVLYELQGLADAAGDERRARGRRGLDVLGALQRSAGVALQIADRDYPDIAAVDAKLVAMARERNAGLVTVDGNLERVAEVQGVKVLNLHALGETLRPPVLPGQALRVRVVKPGKEPGQGVGYLSDGTMVVVEGARGRLHDEVSAEVTSILSNPNGRMVFATLLEHPPSPSSDPRPPSTHPALPAPATGLA